MRSLIVCVECEEYGGGSYNEVSMCECVERGGYNEVSMCECVEGEMRSLW